MNKRIQELTEHCTTQYRDGHGGYVDQVDVEKFAELIVRECQDNLSWHGHDEAVSQLDWLKVNRFGLKR